MKLCGYRFPKSIPLLNSISAGIQLLTNVSTTLSNAPKSREIFNQIAVSGQHEQDLLMEKCEKFQVLENFKKTHHFQYLISRKSNKSLLVVPHLEYERFEGMKV